MLKIKDMQSMNQSFKVDSSITSDRLCELIEEAAEQKQVPAAVETDSLMMSEGLGGLISRINDERGDPCVAVYHPEHRKDYNAYCVRLSTQGTSAYASVYVFGTSQQQVKIARSEYNKQARKRMTLGQKAINATVSGLINMGKDPGKFANELDWYTAICEAIGFALAQVEA